MGSVPSEPHGLGVRGPLGETEPQLWGEVRIGPGDKTTGTRTPVASTGDSDVQSD